MRLTADDGELAASDDVHVTLLPPQELPDLTVEVDASGASFDPLDLAVTGTVTATVTNHGPGAALGRFSIAIFEDRDLDGAFQAAQDNLLATSEPPLLLPGESAAVSVTVQGTLLFAWNRIFALADSESAIAETDETNNYGDSTPACEVRPLESVNPRIEWHWRGSESGPEWSSSLTAPAVMDLDRDGFPEVIFAAQLAEVNGPGRLTAVDGRDGSTVFQVADPGLALASGSQLAVGDLDLDGFPEIVAVGESYNELIVFEHDGAFKWRAATEVLPFSSIGFGGASLADLDAGQSGPSDGVPEIIVGRQVFDAAGNLRWTGAGYIGKMGVPFSAFGYVSTVADIDLDGVPEVLSGSTVYRLDPGPGRRRIDPRRGRDRRRPPALPPAPGRGAVDVAAPLHAARPAGGRRLRGAARPLHMGGAEAARRRPGRRRDRRCGRKDPPRSLSWCRAPTAEQVGPLPSRSTSGSSSCSRMPTAPTGSSPIDADRTGSSGPGTAR